MAQGVGMYAITQPLTAFEILPPLPGGMKQRITHGYGLQAVIQHQGLNQILNCVVEGGVVEEGAPAVEGHHGRVLPVG